MAGKTRTSKRSEGQDDPEVELPIRCPFPGCGTGLRDASNPVSRMRSHLRNKHVGWCPPGSWLKGHASWFCDGKDCGLVLAISQPMCRVCCCRRADSDDSPAHEARQSDHRPGLQLNHVESVSLGSSEQARSAGVSPKTEEDSLCKAMGTLSVSPHPKPSKAKPRSSTQVP